MSSDPASEHEGERSGPTVRDRRRIDPDTYQVREPQDAAPAPGGATGTTNPSSEHGDAPAAEKDTRVTELETALAERTADLQRLQAEYANYRKRVERDRVAVVEIATAGLLHELLPVLDDVDRARDHGDLTGAFQAVGERLEAVVQKAGLEKFGEVGEPFDPAVHEALLQAEPDPAADVGWVCCSAPSSLRWWLLWSSWSPC